MADPKVVALHSAEFGVTDIAAATRFFTDVWGLEQTAEAGGVRFFRGTGPNHHIVVLHERPKAELVRINLLAETTEAVDALHAKVKGYGLTDVEDPAPLVRPGGGYGFAFKDVEGRNLAIATGIAAQARTDDIPDRPRKISHVVFNSGDSEKSIAMFRDLAGFKISDSTRMMTFLRCNSDHHSIAVTHAKNEPTLHHIAFEMPDLDSVMRGAGRCRDHDCPIEWGVGRHGPGNNVFAYFVGPENFPIEYTAEVEQVDDSYPTGGPDDWGFPQGRSDRWGVTNPPSQRMAVAEKAIRFADRLHVAA